MRVQLAAVLIAAAIALALVGFSRLRALVAGRRSRGSTGLVGDAPQILYFSSQGCTTCRTKQEPALESLKDASVRKLDAVRDGELASRFHVYTVPATVVLSADGSVVDVNYGFAPAARLASQLKRAESIKASPTAEPAA